MSDYVPGWSVAAPNYERPAFSPVEKPVPHKLLKDKAKAAVKTQDQQERDKCHDRSGGRCEVFILAPGQGFFRCDRRVKENHHLKGGIGRRNRGASLLAAHRLDTCTRCHDDITGKVLVPVDALKKEDAATVRYERRKL